ncbi:MAG: SDR family NAD(P)-dependent oxidoreductase [Desulfobulbaceae bacterium]|nr:SDR family NAD(P)-dependent oxidoreductase [Desulfobulbaceae bacterium]
MEQFRFIASTIPGNCNPSPAIAGCRAGALGVLDVQFEQDWNKVSSALNKLAQYTSGEYGIKISTLNFDRSRFETLPPSVRNRLKTIIISHNSEEGLADLITYLHGLKIRILLECISYEQAVYGAGRNVDGLIAKGLESGGRIGKETTFILLQHLLAEFPLPVWAHGGISLHTAAGCFAAGAAGVVLDAQLLLTRESPFSREGRDLFAGMDGRETVCLGDSLDMTYRVCSRIARNDLDLLHQAERSLRKKKTRKSEKIKEWNQVVCRHLSQNGSGDNLLGIGEDIAFAHSLAQKYLTIGGILQAMREQIAESCLKAARLRPLGPNSPLAGFHGTKYPIVQGPMARVSDKPDFAWQVAVNGALPFIAAAWLRRDELDRLLDRTAAQLQDKPWGVGLLGFLPPDVYREQVEILLARLPPFALIAGGRPPQVEQLEKAGIKTYIHVPTAGLLKMFLDAGLKNFVFEGREAGGHVGPLCSFVHWQSMILQLLEYLAANKKASGYNVLFAGGIKDSRSSAMIAAMASELADKGVSIGVQLGSAYLFTEEAVKTGAIIQKFQDELLRCTYTTLLETGPGHAVRCIDTPFARFFNKEKIRMQESGMPREQIRQTLEKMELGRLRIAAKGLAYDVKSGAKGSATVKLIYVSPEEQLQNGIYMIGQLATLQKSTRTIAELHHDISVLGTGKSDESAFRGTVAAHGRKKEKPSDVAIIGMACFFPEAPDLGTYWQNILNSVNAIKEIPENRWDYTSYFDQNKDAKDRIYSKWGAFLDDIPFDPLTYGMPPNVLASVEPLHLLALEAVRFALKDAGYARRPFARDRTAVVVGISGAGEIGQLYGFRASLPMFFGERADTIASHFDSVLPEWTEDSFPGLLMNVAAGRIANRFDLGGMNTLVDSACASSLAALYLGVKELETGACDMAIVGGADCMQNPFTYMCFSKTQALSPRGVCNSLDANADGIVIGEGLATVILKRLADAERDGDRIYSVIKGMGASSDGRDRSLTAPGQAGQVRALQRAYAKANMSPAHVELMEAHATGTTEGDKVEIGSLTQLMLESGAPGHGCAIGSVKSMIGHTKSTAGLASLIKTAMALHHKVIPPTMGVKMPNPGLQVPDSPFYIPDKPKPWIPRKHNCKRKAGVSAFGFGGTNYHAVLEEYTGDFLERFEAASFRQWPGELFYWHGTSRSDLAQTVDSFTKNIQNLADDALGNLAFGCGRKSSAHPSLSQKNRMSLAIVASSKADLLQKLQAARKALAGTDKVINDPRGIFFTESPLARDGKIAFLFPGQGSQYVNMLADLAIQFPDIRRLFELSDRLLSKRLQKSLGAIIYPSAAFSNDENQMQARALALTNVAQPAMGTADLALYSMLTSMQVKPDMVAGHSYGEYVALCAAGVLKEEELILLSEARARFILEGAGANPGIMAAVEAEKGIVNGHLSGIDGVWVANINSPVQTVITGTREGIEKAVNLFTEKEIRARIIPVSCAFHSPLMQPACRKLGNYLAKLQFNTPLIPVYSNTTGDKYPAGAQAIKKQLLQHVVRGVDFVKEIETMYAHGARIFVEVGPGRVLSGLTAKILENRPHETIVSNQANRSGFTQLQHMTAQLIAHGIVPDTGILYRGRDVEAADDEKLHDQAKLRGFSSTTYLVNGSTIRRPEKGQPKPVRRIQPYPLPEERTAAVESFRKMEPLEQGAFPDERGSAMLLFQKQMQQFLDTQKKIMSLYLRQPASSNAGQEGSSVHEKVQACGKQPAFPANPPASGTQSQESPAAADLPAKQGEAVPVSQEIDVQGKTGTDNPASRLLQIVSQRTGYPEEMLDMNLDLEAELGIDSIKRVEILGEFLREVLPDAAAGAADPMESLRGVSTLQGIIDWTAARNAGSRQSPVHNFSRAESSTADKPMAENVVELPHFTLRPVRIQEPSMRLQMERNRVVLLTDDGRGVAEIVAEKLKEDGFSAALLHWRECRPDDSSGKFRYRVKGNGHEALKEVVDAIRRDLGPIGSIVHLRPIREQKRFEELDFAAWKENLHDQLYPLYHLVRLLHEDLSGPAAGGKSVVLAATSMGGAFGLDFSSAMNGFNAGQAAVGGFLKTVALEYPEAAVKIVDFSPDQSAAEQAACIGREMAAGDGLVEVGYLHGQRMSPGLFESTADRFSGNAITIEQSSILLITGGARGITAKIALEIARRYRPVLILLGRSPLPPEEESGTLHLTSPKELKGAIIAGMKARGMDFQLGDVEKAYQQLRKNREILANLAALRGYGATVEYIAADVRDEKAFTGAIADIYRKYGKIDGIIHGAGLIEDKLLKDKTPESFGRVFGTKAESIYLLAKTLKPGSLKFLALFSSVAGRFGSIGQSDYTAANEVLNKTALYLDRQWPGRVVALNWGPWEGAGMASEEVLKQFAERQVGLIKSGEGAEAFLREICLCRKGDVEVVIGDGPWRRGVPAQALAASPSYDPPLLQSSADPVKTGGFFEFSRTLSLENDLYLMDHCLEGKPVLPATIAIELMAEAAQAAHPDMRVNAVKNIRVFKGIILEGRERQLLVRVAFRAQDQEDRGGLELDVDIVDPHKQKLPFYRSSIVLTKEPPVPEQYSIRRDNRLEPFPLSISEAYDRWLFHGPLFRCIRKIEGISDDAMEALLTPSSPLHNLAGRPESHWIADPVVLDGGLQMALLWARSRFDITVLPSGFKAVRIMRPFHTAEFIHCFMEIVSTSGEQSIVYNMMFTDENFDPIGMIEEVEATGSKALNRLTGPKKLLKN